MGVKCNTFARWFTTEAWKAKVKLKWVKAMAKTVHKRKIRWQKSAIVGLTVFGFILLAIILAPFITSYDPVDQVLVDRLQKPSLEHILGTDFLGRDVFARILYGGRVAISMTTIVVLITASFGTILGAISARRGGLTDELIMRVTDLALSFPLQIVALVMVGIMDPGVLTLIVAMTVLSWTPYTRLARAVCLEINTRVYMEAAKVLGASEFFIFRKHVLPNMLGTIMATFFLRFGHTLLILTGLSYLGLGSQPQNPDWGLMLSEAVPYMKRVPTLIMAPGIMIFVTTISVTIAGQGLSLMFDPRMKSVVQIKKMKKK
jgi:ABC-type dipeptide/oligopeptide/nickel transport system permease subunit